MMQAALLVLAQPEFVRQRIETQFCPKAPSGARDHCLASWRARAD